MTAAAPRRLRWAIGASLLAHLLLLGGIAPSPLRTETPALVARLNVQPAPPQSQARPSATAPASPSAAPAPIRPRPVAPPPSPPSPHASPVPPAPAMAKADPAPQPLVAPGSAASPSPPAPAASTAGDSEGAALTGEAADALRAYRLGLASQARRFKRYPAQAMAAGWSGVADVRVMVDAGGRPRTELARSSGHPSLDGAALAMIGAGALRTRVPEGLRGKPFTVVLPVVFDLDEE